MKRRALSSAIYALTTAIGLVAFLYPFLLPSLRSSGLGLAHSADAPLLLTALVGLAFVVLLLEVQGQAVNAKLVALLGVLVAMNSVLRFLEIAVPGPGGVSPVFFLIILTGYVYGGRFGFLMGALTLLVSGLITGSLGPWLPYQMLTAGWVGMSAPAALRRGDRPGGLCGAMGLSLWRHHEHLVLALCHRPGRAILAAGHGARGDSGALRDVLPGDLGALGRAAGGRQRGAGRRLWCAHPAGPGSFPAAFRL
jgi:energy-coupling factor transport system substrate-specific component